MVGFPRFAGLILVCTLSPQAAYAYIDPGTGSMALQAVLAIVAGGAVFATRWIGWLRDRLRRLVGAKGASDHEQGNSPEADQ